MVQTDSRKVKKGDVFVAYKGVSVDGHDFIDQAIENGAVKVIGERDLNLKVPYQRVENGRLAWAQEVAKFYKNPETKLKIIGVTGTDGKTTTTNLIYQILKAAGKKVGMVSTINAIVGDKKIETGLHTSSLDPDELWKILAQLVKQKTEYVVLETTSHGLAQDRFGKIIFEVGVITNLAHDHLEFHKTIDEYAKAKAILMAKSKISVINNQINQKEIFVNAARGNVIFYDLKSDDLNDIKTSLQGDYNKENILAAIKTAEVLGIDREATRRGIANLKNLKGRFEMVPNKLGINLVVDFAHTEQGLKNVLSLVRKEKLEKGRQLVVVFGCNGERDRSKRAPMGKVASELADRVIITTEDPRKERVDQIFSDIELGCLQTRKNNYERVDDRKEAIKMAIGLAKKGDWVLFLGKGHEQSMNFKGVETPWNEVEVVRESLGELLT